MSKQRELVERRNVKAVGTTNRVEITALTARVTVLEALYPLASLIGADFNVTTDQALTLPASYILRKIVVTNASISLTTAAGGIYTGASKTGTALVSAAQVYTALTAASKYLELTLASLAGTDVLTDTSLFLSLTTPQGAAATADVYLFGESLV